MGSHTQTAESPANVRAFTLRLAAGVIVINLIVIGLAIFVLHHSRQQHEERAKVNAQNLSRVLEHNIAGVIDKTDIVLLTVADEAERQDSSGSIDQQTLNEFMTRQLSRLPEFDYLRMADVRGDIIYGNGLIEGKKFNIADRDYFTIHRNNPKTGLYISKPVLGRFTKKWMVILSRRVSRLNGSLLGVVWATIPLDYLSTQFASLDVGPHGGISLRDKDMGIIARYPVPKDIGSVIGNKAMSPELRKLFESGQSARTFFTTQGWDNIPKVVSYRKIANYPLYVNIGLATSDYLAEWWDDVAIILVLVALYLLVTLLMARAIFIRWQKEKLAENLLHQLNEELEMHVVERTRDLVTANERMRVVLADRVRMDRALAEKEIRLRTLVQTIPDLIWLKDAVGVYLSCNPMFERLFGARETDIVGKTDYDFVDRELADFFREYDCKAIVAGKPCINEEWLTFADDGYKGYFETIKAPVLDAEGKLIGVLGIARDITDRKQAEIELLKKNNELERFTYTVSHDLKSPLITIQSFAGQIKQDLETGRHARIPDDLKRIADAAAKMTILLDDLLKLSRVGRMMNPPTELDMGRLVKDVLAQLAGPLKQKQIELMVHSDLHIVHGDQQRISEVLQNLVENAIKYMGVQDSPRIEIGVRKEVNRQVLFVSDNGKGIDPQFHESIFGLFNKINGNSEGTGIGLALVKRIIEVHGGRVWVESEGVGKGSTFCFSLPEKCQQPTENHPATPGERL